MLSEYRKIYEKSASQIQNWVDLSKSELCKKYLFYKDIDPLVSECYLAGLIAKCIKRAEKEYTKQYYKSISELDYYNVIIEAIMTVLKDRAWEKESSTLYGNKDAPEIAINTCIKSALINLFIYLQRDKRKLNNGLLSLDFLEEFSADGYFLPYKDKDISIDLYTRDIIKKSFNKKEYLNAFILDSILNKNVFINSQNGLSFSPGRLRSVIKGIDINYCKIFAHNYEIDLKEVENSIPYIKNINNERLDYYIHNLIKKLKKDKELDKMVHNAY